MNMIAIVQARCSSSRLPGKVLKPILGKPMLLHQIERLRRCTAIDRLVVVTSDQASDIPLTEMLEQYEVDYFCGSLEDVLDRYFQAASHYGAEHVVRLTGDCPLIDPEIVDRVIQAHLDGNYEYTSNVLPPTFPDGLDTEVMRFETLQMAWKNAELPSDREHVTSYIHQRSEQFRLGNVTAKEDFSMFRWTVDEPEDFDFVSTVYEELYPVNQQFATLDIFELLKKKPELLEVNRHIGRNEGMHKSLVVDREMTG